MIAPGFAAIRIVRTPRDDRAPPAIELPPGWSDVADTDHAVTSDSEHYRFLQGPRAAEGALQVTWPGSEIVAAVYDGRRLDLARDGGAVRIRVRLDAPSVRQAWPTIEIHSHLDERDLPLRIEHHHPGRRAGWYRQHAWVAGEARAALNFIFAGRTMLRDWGIHCRLAAQRTGRIELLGFESNNPLHGDAPPHWHLAHYLSDERGSIPHDAPGSQIPHFYLDPLGRVVANQQDIMQHPERARRLGPGQPMLFHERGGAPLFTMTVTAAGGVAVSSPAGEALYELVGAGTDRDAREVVSVLRRGQPWATVQAHDDTDLGELRVRVERDNAVETDAWRYDPLIGRAVARMQ